MIEKTWRHLRVHEGNIRGGNCSKIHHDVNGHERLLLPYWNHGTADYDRVDVTTV